MIKILQEDRKSFKDKFGEELLNLFLQKRGTLPAPYNDMSYWESEYKRNTEIGRQETTINDLNELLGTFNSETAKKKFNQTYGCGLYYRLKSIMDKLPDNQRTFEYWSQFDKADIWEQIDKYLPQEYWDKVDEGSSVVYEDSDWTVYEITNYEASEYYGRNTGWCISGNYPGAEDRGKFYFYDYASEYYFYVDKGFGMKYCAFDGDEGTQIWLGIDNEGRTVDENVTGDEDAIDGLPEIDEIYLGVTEDDSDGYTAYMLTHYDWVLDCRRNIYAEYGYDDNSYLLVFRWNPRDTYIGEIVYNAYIGEVLWDEVYNFRWKEDLEYSMDDFGGKEHIERVLLRKIGNDEEKLQHYAELKEAKEPYKIFQDAYKEFGVDLGYILTDELFDTNSTSELFDMFLEGSEGLYRCDDAYMRIVEY